MKKIIALLLALTLVLTMVGCGGKKEYLAGTVSDTGVVAIGVPGQPANTDPALYDGSLAARAVLGMLFLAVFLLMLLTGGALIAAL